MRELPANSKVNTVMKKCTELCYKSLILCSLLLSGTVPAASWAQDYAGEESDGGVLNENGVGEIDLDEIDLPDQGDFPPNPDSNVTVLDEGTLVVPPNEDLNGTGVVADTPTPFYDSNDARGPATLNQKAPPVIADPRKQKGQSYIIVKKDSEAESFEARVVAANRALKLGRTAAALALFEKLYQDNPRDPRVLMGLAVSQQRSGLNASAVETYEELLKRDPDNQNAVINMLGVLQKQYPEVALRRLLELRDKHPSNPGIAAQIGMTQAGLGYYKEALRFLGIASSLEPQNASHVYNMAIVSDRLGKNQDAISLYEEALKLDSVHGAGRSVPRDKIYDRLSALRRL